jgi:hypothetical protein
MAFSFRLERTDGTPADPPSFKTTVLVRNPGERIPLGGRGYSQHRKRMVEPCEEREKGEKCDRVRSPVRSSNLAPEATQALIRPHGPCRDGRRRWSTAGVKSWSSPASQQRSASVSRSRSRSRKARRNTSSSVGADASISTASKQCRRTEWRPASRRPDRAASGAVERDLS